jgi:hypothetical protein
MAERFNFRSAFFVSQFFVSQFFSSQFFASQSLATKQKSASLEKGRGEFLAQSSIAAD